MKDIKIKARKYNNTTVQKIFIFSLLIIPIMNFIVFTVYANIAGIALSFRQFDSGREIWVGFANFNKFFRDWSSSNYNTTVLVSLAYLLVVGCISLPIALTTSFFLYKKIPLSKFFVIILFLPNIIPAAVMAEFYRRMWDMGMGSMPPGVLNQFFSFVEGRNINWLVSIQYANYGVWIYTVWFGFGYNAILLWGAMTRVPKEIIESAYLDGAGLGTEFFKITVPIIWPTLSMVIILTVMVPFTVFMQPLLITNNGDYNTRTVALLSMQELKRPDPYFASAINIIIAFVSIPTILAVKKILEKRYEIVEV